MNFAINAVRLVGSLAISLYALSLLEEEWHRRKARRNAAEPFKRPEPRYYPR